MQKLYQQNVSFWNFTFPEIYVASLEKVAGGGLLFVARFYSNRWLCGVKDDKGVIYSYGRSDLAH